MKKLILALSLVLGACGEGALETQEAFDIDACDAQGGVATINDMGDYKEFTCDIVDEEVLYCYALCKINSTYCPRVECSYD
jgi:hypothetical protein